MTTSGSDLNASGMVLPEGQPNVAIRGFFERRLEGDELAGDADLDEVLRTLRDGRPHVRYNAARWLGRSEASNGAPEKVTAALAPVLRDADGAVKTAAVEALGTLGGAEAVRLLAEALGDPLPAAREAAVRTLHTLGPTALADAVGAQRPADPAVAERQEAGLRALASRIGAEAVQVLADALRGGTVLAAPGRETACRALGDFGSSAEDAVPALLFALRDSDEKVRAAAAQALGFIGVDDEIVLADLKLMLRDPVFPVRRQAALAAARLVGRPLDERKPSEPRPVPIAGFEERLLEGDALASGAASAGLDLLVRALRDGRELVRQNAARAIASLGGSGTAGLDKAAQAIAMLLRDGEVPVRREAAIALKRLGKDALPAAWFLSASLNDSEAEVRDVVVETLTGLFPEVEPFLVEALRTDTDRARIGVLRVWEALEGAGVPALTVALGNPSGLIRLNAAIALELLARKGADRAVPDLEERLNDPIGQVRAAAASALDAIQGLRPRPVVTLEPEPIDVPGFFERRLSGAELDHAVDLDVILRALRNGRPVVRHNAARWLERADASREAPAKVAAALGPALLDGDSGVKLAAIDALGALGGDDAARRLVRALGDAQAEAREAAVKALASIGAEALVAALRAVDAIDPQVVARQESGFRAAAVRCGAPAVEVLADALRGETGLTARQRETACGALGDLGLREAGAADAVPALLLSLRDDNEHVRAAAATALGQVGVQDEIVLSDLRAMQADPVFNVKRQAALAVGRLLGRPLDERKPADAEEVPIPGFDAEILEGKALEQGAAAAGLALLVHALGDGREIVRRNAARAIASLAHAGAGGLGKAAKPIGMLLRDGEVAVRRDAALALKALAQEGLPAAWFLSAALVDGDAEVRAAVVETLVALHPDDEPFLVEALRIDTERAQGGIFVVWDQLAHHGVPGLAEALRNPSALIRLNAALALERLAKKGASQAMGELEARLSDPVRQVRIAAEAAIDAIQGGKPRPVVVLEPDLIDIDGFHDRLLDEALLAQRTDRASPERLVRHMRDGRAWVRANAVTLLGHHAASDALSAALPGVAVLARDEAIEVRRAATGALSRLLENGAAETDRYAEVLVMALGDRAPSVRKVASAGLAALGERAFPALALGLGASDDRILQELVPLFLALGEPALTALPDALSPLTPELHIGALVALKAFPREGLAPARPLVVPLIEPGGDANLRAAAIALLDKIDGKDLIPTTREPTPLPLPGFADDLLSRESLAAAASDMRFDLLTHAMTDGRDTVRANATTGLEVIGSGYELSWPYLARALKDPATEVRVRAAEAFAVMPPRRDVAFELVRVLDDRSPRVVTAAEAALRAYGEFALDAFMFALDDAPELVGRSILPMIASLGERAIDQLVLAQRYDSPLVRRNALIGLRLLDRDLAKSARATVAQARKDDDREVRLEALRTLDWIDGIEYVYLREPRVLPNEAFEREPIPAEVLADITASYDAKALTELLVDGRRAVRENAATAHGVLGRFHPWLGILLKDSVAAVQVAAAKALRDLGDKALPAAPALIGALLEDEPEVREHALNAMLGFGKKALPVLIEGLWVPGDVARKTVVPLIDALGKDATPSIIEALDHRSQLVVLNALQVLGRLYAKDDKGAVKGMAKVQALTRNPLPAIIGAAQKCLFRLEGRTPAEFQKEPVPMPITGFDKGPLSADVLKVEAPKLDTEWMISAFSDGRPIVRENAARAAGYMPKALKDLLTPLTIALKDGIPEVQVAAADAFAVLRAEDATAIPALTFAQKKATDRVKRACMVALEAYGPERVAAELVNHLVGREDWMLVTIGRVAARMPEVLVPALASYAGRSDASLIARENAVRVIGDLGQKARAAEQALVALLPEMEGMLACKAAFAIGCVARPSKELIEAMQARLEVDPRPSLHQEIRSAVRILKRRLPPGASL